MIIAKLFAGLGNQMFEYAAAKSLALVHNTNVKLDTFSYLFDSHRVYGLDAFCVEAELATLKDLTQISVKHALWCYAQYGHRSLLRKICNKTLCALGIENNCQVRYYEYDSRQPLPPLLIGNVVSQRMFHFDPEFFQSPNNVITCGTWVSYKYFEHIRNIVKTEFTLKKPSERYKWLEDSISDNTSIAVHVRRTDKLIGSGYHQINLDFYNKAINYFRERLPDSRFFVFSDDITWAKKKLDSADIIHIESDGDVHPAEDMILMSRCQHNVVPASSYSWWAAWLNDNPGKQILTTPLKYWGWNGAPNWNLSSVVPSEWITIS